jgi:biopolymer transport protein ExbB/TolQ
MIASLFHRFQAGGIYMWPILVCALITLAITAERYWFLYRIVAEDKLGLLKGVNQHVMKGDVSAAVRFLDSQKPGPLARVLKSGLLKAHRDDFEVQAALDEASLRELPNIEKRVGFLAVLSNGATLVGLLGTINGMIACFGAVANVDPSQKATILAEGISEAMNCTAFGLLTAIPALFIFGVLQAKVQHIIDDINECIVSEMNLVLGSKKMIRSTAEALGQTAK